MTAETLLPRVMFLFGVGFLAANLVVIVHLVRYLVRKRSALLVWQAAKPRFYGFSLGLGVVLGLLVAFKLLVLHRQVAQVFGDAMMFVYYGYALPLSTRIQRGFYGDGVWADTGFLPWGQIAAVSWKHEAGVVMLILIARHRQIARQLAVPGSQYGAVRRLLRDRIQAHDIHFGGSGIDLGSRDERDTI